VDIVVAAHHTMARPLRMQYEGAFYHVMNRGNARQPIFRLPEHYKIFINLLVESVVLWEIKIHGFSLLSNHYHLLIKHPVSIRHLQSLKISCTLAVLLFFPKCLIAAVSVLLIGST